MWWHTLIEPDFHLPALRQTRMVPNEFVFDAWVLFTPS
jgi:hypothetical protein